MRKLFTLQDNKKELDIIIPKIDYSDALSPNSTRDMVIKACGEVQKYGFATVCVYPTWVSLAKEHMQDTKQGILVTVGFPHGSTETSPKVAETQRALDDGATEIDMVINLARFFSKDYGYVKNDISEVVKCSANKGVGVKVILETGYYNDEEKKIAVELAVESGAEYIKTCTGYGPGRATIHDVLLIKSIVGDRAKIKASGGIASIEDQWEFIQCGASRVAGRYNIVEQLNKLGIK